MKLPIRTAVLCLGTAALVAACADAPSAPARQPGEPRFDHSPSISISGPNVITRSGSYTYYANPHNLLEPTFKWSTRTCPNSDVANCTSSWTIHTWTSADYFTTQLSVDCSGDGLKVFQISVIARSWNASDLTDTHVTALCPDTYYL